jgi:hypothetical protein
MRLVPRPVAIPGFHETCITVSSTRTFWYRLRVKTININKFLQKLAIGIDLVVIHKRLAAKLFDVVSRPPHTRRYLPQSRLQGIMSYGQRRDTATCLVMLSRDRPTHTLILALVSVARYHGIRWAPWYCDLPRDKLILRPIPWNNAIHVETCCMIPMYRGKSHSAWPA